MSGEIWPEPRYGEKFKLQASLPKLRSEYHARKHTGVDRPSRRESFVAAGGNWAECLVGLYPAGDAHLGELQELIEADGLTGVTANPSIFEKAIAGSHDYDQAIRTLGREGKSPDAMYETLAVEDVGHAADLFRSVFERLTDGTVLSAWRSPRAWLTIRMAPSPKPGVSGPRWIVLMY